MSHSVTRRELLKLGAVAGAGLAAGARPTVAHAADLPPTPAPAGLTAADELEDLLKELVARHRVPGAIAGISRGGQVSKAAVGTANLNTGLPMTPDLAFIAGSITKVWTTTLAMTFVDDGTVKLDVPVQHYLPKLRFGDPGAARVVTLRQLLNHSSGLDVGDYFLDRGAGPCGHQIYVDALAHIGQIHRPGAYSSYCNGGFMIVANLLETLSKRSWYQLLTDRVIAPMGLTRTYVDAEDGVLHGMVVGNLPDPSAPSGHRAVPKLLLPRMMAPVGTTLIFNVEDLLAFARMHQNGGVADNGKRILSETSARAMATRTIAGAVPHVAGFGLGWMHATVGGRTVLSHGGGSNGGRSLVMIIPDSKLAIASFVNTSSPGEFQNELHDRMAANYGAEGVTTSVWAPVPNPPASLDLSRFVGTYRRKSTKMTVRPKGSGLELAVEWILSEAEGTEAYGQGTVTTFDVVAVAPNVLVLPGTTRLSRGSGWIFLEPDRQGRFGLLFEGGRLSRRIG